MQQEASLVAEEHIVSSYDEELGQLRETVARMGALAGRQLAAAVQAMARRDADLARRTILADQELDALEVEIDDRCVKLVALRQPVADDLRIVLSGLKISADIERIGDYAANIAKRALALVDTPPVPQTRLIPRMSRLVEIMTGDVMTAWNTLDAGLARDVWERDEEVDSLYTSLFRELLTYMMEDPRSITACTHLLFVAKNVERCGDKVTNIAEMVLYLVEGSRPHGVRPKADLSSFTVPETLPEAKDSDGPPEEKAR